MFLSLLFRKCKVRRSRVLTESQDAIAVRDSLMISSRNPLSTWSPTSAALTSPSTRERLHTPKGILRDSVARNRSGSSAWVNARVWDQRNRHDNIISVGIPNIHRGSQRPIGQKLKRLRGRTYVKGRRETKSSLLWVYHMPRGILVRSTELQEVKGSRWPVGTHSLEV